MDNRKVLEDVSEKYETKKDYDYVNTLLAFNIFKNNLVNKSILEVGCADGAMTEIIVKYANYLDVIEPSKRYCEMARKIDGVADVYNCFTHEIDNPKKYDVVLLASLLHHIENPIDFLIDIKKFLKPNSIVLATVPNVKSLHRKIGVKMGVLKDEYGNSERNKKLHQFGRFDKEKFQNVFVNSGYQILESYGYMIKPFSSEIMEKIDLNQQQIEAMFEIGKEFEEISSQLFIKVKI